MRVMSFKYYLKSMLKGRLLLSLGADRYLPQILYFFAMALLFIWINIGIENTLHHREQNKKILENMRSVHTEMTCRLTGLNSVCKVEDMLESMGSSLGIPDKKAVKK